MLKLQPSCSRESTVRHSWVRSMASRLQVHITQDACVRVLRRNNCLCSRPCLLRRLLQSLVQLFVRESLHHHVAQWARCQQAPPFEMTGGSLSSGRIVV